MPHWSKFFSKLKNCEKKPIWDLSNHFKPNQRVYAWGILKHASIKIMSYWGKKFPSSGSWKNLFQYSILRQNSSISKELKILWWYPTLGQFVRGQKKIIRLDDKGNGPREGVWPNIYWKCASWRSKTQHLPKWASWRSKTQYLLKWISWVSKTQWW